MDVKTFYARYPDIDPEELYPLFPRIPMPGPPEWTDRSSALYTGAGEPRFYTWEECHRGFRGAGGLFLVSEMANRLALAPGQCVLDLCCGNGISSIFLARHYGVRIMAVDLNVDPSANWRRAQEADVADLVTPLRMDARDLTFPQGYFDAIFCLNSYFYFGTHDLYLPYLCRFLRPGGRIGIASPCYARELPPDPPRELLYDAPHYVESYAVHSPNWWRRHFERRGLVDVLCCREHPRGRAFWLDEVRWLLEQAHPREMEPWMREMVRQEIAMLLSDEEAMVTYLTLLAQKRAVGNHLTT